MRPVRFKGSVDHVTNNSFYWMGLRVGDHPHETTISFATIFLVDFVGWKMILWLPFAGKPKAPLFSVVFMCCSFQGGFCMVAISVSRGSPSNKKMEWLDMPAFAIVKRSPLSMEAEPYEPERFGLPNLT